MPSDNEPKKKGKTMVSFGVRLQPGLLQQAKDKAGLIPLSRIIRLLIEKWVKGEIDLDE